MIERIVPFKLQPGVYRNGTKYQAKGRWYDSDLVRWFEGTLQPVGGWTEVLSNAAPGVPEVLTGFPRGAHAWRFDDATSWMGIGTHSKLYVYSDGVLSDITPASWTSGAVNGGINEDNLGLSYGNGPYGNFVYGSGTGSRSIVEADTWTHDNFGQFLVSCFTKDGRILVWQNNRATPTAPASGAPTGCTAVVVTPEHFVFALGAGGNKRRIDWASQNSTTDWTPVSTNTAGSIALTTEGKIITGTRLRRETLIWTDVDVHAALYVGGDFVYRLESKGSNCGIASPNAWAVARGAAFWMSDKKFFMFDGQVQEVQCDVSDDIFNDLNLSNRAKIWASALPQYNEIWWFFPSANQSGAECDRYAIYNYAERHWAVGRLSRASGVGRGVFDTPLWVKPTGEMMQHETGLLHDARLPFAESGPQELGDGDVVMRIQEILPDEKTLGDVSATFFSAYGPTDSEKTRGPYILGSSPRSVRFGARQIRVRVQEIRNTSWRVGNFRFGILPGGHR